MDHFVIVAWQIRKYYPAEDGEEAGWGKWHTVSKEFADRCHNRPNRQVRALYAYARTEENE